jgi:hypothetical protein
VKRTRKRTPAAALKGIKRALAREAIAIWRKTHPDPEDGSIPPPPDMTWVSRYVQQKFVPLEAGVLAVRSLLQRRRARGGAATRDKKRDAARAEAEGFEAYCAEYRARHPGRFRVDAAFGFVGDEAKKSGQRLSDDERARRMKRLLRRVREARKRKPGTSR